MEIVLTIALIVIIMVYSTVAIMFLYKLMKIISDIATIHSLNMDVMDKLDNALDSISDNLEKIHMFYRVKFKTEFKNDLDSVYHKYIEEKINKNYKGDNENE